MALKCYSDFYPSTKRHSEASSRSAISSNLVTLFQFLPVPGTFSVFSRTAQDNFGRVMPLG